MSCSANELPAVRPAVRIDSFISSGADNPRMILPTVSFLLPASSESTGVVELSTVDFQSQKIKEQRPPILVYPPIPILLWISTEKLLHPNSRSIDGGIPGMQNIKPGPSIRAQLYRLPLLVGRQLCCLFDLLPIRLTVTTASNSPPTLSPIFIQFILPVGHLTRRTVAHGVVHAKYPMPKQTASHPAVPVRSDVRHAGPKEPRPEHSM